MFTGVFTNQIWQKWLLFFFCLVQSTLWAAADPLIEIATAVERKIGAALDVQSGAGTGHLARELRQIAQELAEATEAVGAENLQANGFSLARIGQLVREANGGPLVMELIQYQRTIQQAQLRLRRAGIDFVTLNQHPAARLIERYREFCRPFSSEKISPEELAALSNLLTGTSTEDAIMVPVTQTEIDRGNARLAKLARSGDFRFVKPDSVQSDEDVVLPPIGEPLHAQRLSKRQLTTLRNWISPPVAFIGSLTGNGFQLPGFMAGATASLLEWQFSKASHFWAYIWDRYKFAGNVTVNALYGIILTAVLSSTEALLQQDLSTNPREFFVKSMFMCTATWVASFGAMQIKSSELQQVGELSETGRFKLEVYSVLWNNFGRVLALGAAGLGIQYQVNQVAGVGIGLGEWIGWGIQFAYLAALTAPMYSKAWMGDAAYDAVTRYYFDRAAGIPHEWDLSLLGKIRARCNYALAWLANRYTFTRVAVNQKVE